MVLAEIVDMCRLALPRKRLLPGENRLDDFRHLVGLDDGLPGATLNVAGDISNEHDFGGHFRLESHLSGKSHDCLEILHRNAKTFRQCGKMLIVLAQRILETVSASKVRHGPLGRLRVAKDPSGVCLRLNDKNAPLGDDDVVYLRCGTVLCWKHDIVQDVVLLAVQFDLEEVVEKHLAEPALDIRAERLDEKQGDKQ